MTDALRGEFSVTPSTARGQTNPGFLLSEPGESYSTSKAYCNARAHDRARHNTGDLGIWRAIILPCSQGMNTNAVKLSGRSGYQPLTLRIEPGFVLPRVIDFSCFLSFLWPQGPLSTICLAAKAKQGFLPSEGTYLGSLSLERSLLEVFADLQKPEKQHIPRRLRPFSRNPIPPAPYLLS